MSYVGEFVEEHELLHFTISCDPPSEITLEGGQSALQNCGQIRAGEGDGHVRPPALAGRLADTPPRAGDVDVENLRPSLSFQDLQLVDPAGL